MRIAYDFDEVIAEGTKLPWGDPQIGKPLEPGVSSLKKDIADGHEVFIFTSRPWSHLPTISRWLLLLDIWVPVICEKPRYDIFYDDRARQWPSAQ